MRNLLGFCHLLLGLISAAPTMTLTKQIPVPPPPPVPPPTPQGPCPKGLTAMARFRYVQGASGRTAPAADAGRTYTLLACEDVSSGNGTMVFTEIDSDADDADLADGASSSPFPVTLRKRVFTNTDTGSSYLNYTKAEVLAAQTDLLGNQLLGIQGFEPRAAEATWDEVAAAIPPIRSIGAFANGAGNPRVWTANRESGRDITFDETGYNHLSGAPGPANVQHLLPGLRRDRQGAPLGFTAEGTVVGTAAIVLNFPPAPAANGTNVTLWEMSVVPVPNNTGFVQPVFVRFLQVNGTERPQTLYFDSMVYVPSKCTGDPYDDEVAGCDAPGNYFR